MNKNPFRTFNIILTIATLAAVAAIPTSAYAVDLVSQPETSANGSTPVAELPPESSSNIAQAPDDNDNDDDDNDDGDSVNLERDDDNDNDDDDNDDGDSVNLERDDDNDDDDDDNDNDGDVVIDLEPADEADLPDSVRAAVLQAIATESNLSVSELTIVQVQRATWTDGCLGLGGAAESCLAAMVPGWFVAVASDDRVWAYRANESGSAIRFDETATETVTIRRTETRVERRVTQTTEPQRGSVEVEQRSTTGVVAQETTFSQTVQTAVFQAIAQRSNVEGSNLRVVEVRQKTWSDGCLGIVSTRSCTQAQVPGWLVVVTDGQQDWVYRTDRTGAAVSFDAAATETRTAQRRIRDTVTVSFVDVPANYWASGFISELAALNIIAGYPDGRYRPEQAVTRAEFAAIVRQAFEVTDIRNSIRFVDIDPDYWAYSAIQEGYTAGFVNAIGSNEFRPTTSLARGEVLLGIARGLKLSTTEVESVVSTYSDVALSASESLALLAALTEQGIVVNYPDVRQLNLNRVATRAEVAALVYQALVSLGRVESISSPYIVPGNAVVIRQDGAGRASRDIRQNCNQGIGNGAEGCDPGNSAPRGGSNDEGGRTPGN